MLVNRVVLPLSSSQFAFNQRSQGFHTAALKFRTADFGQDEEFLSIESFDLRQLTPTPSRGDERAMLAPGRRFANRFPNDSRKSEGFGL